MLTIHVIFTRTLNSFIDRLLAFFLWFLYVLYVIFLIVPLFKTKKSRLYLALASLILYFIPIDLPHEFCLFEFKKSLLFLYVRGVMRRV